MSRKDKVALGSQRESLSVNPLLVHSELGKPRRRCFTLPPADFTYGMRSVCLDGGASEALSSWNVHHPTRGPLKKEPERNFIALNTRSVQCGLTTAQEQTQFRATHDIRRRDDEERKKASSAKIRFPPDMVFGISTRPSTPVFDLLEHRYGERWLEERREAERKQRQKNNKKRLQGVYETRASLMRRYSEPVDPPPLWKMKRWQKIGPMLTTFRTDEAHSTAFHHHASDAVSRTGVFGHGIYEAAKC
jgi:hypothetical protein